MKRRVLDWLSTILERLLLLVDGKAPTKIRMKALTPAVLASYAVSRKSKERLRMAHRCNIPPWGSLGSNAYCPLCRTERVYVPLSHDQASRSNSHVLAYPGKRDAPGVIFRRFVGQQVKVIDNHLCFADGVPVITGRLFKPMAGRV